jgi:hypothetical protein
MDKQLTKLEREIKSGISNAFTRELIIYALFGTSLIIGIVLASVALSKQCNCQSDPLNLTTSNGSVTSPKISLVGYSGILPFKKQSGTIGITDLRNLTPYVVSLDGDSEYTSPQAAYLAAVNAGDTTAVIMILPGTYSYGTTQFLIETSGISFISTAQTANSVIFTADDANGGITVNIPLSVNQDYVTFKGITFGKPSNNTGFLLNISGGQTVLDSCFASNSNFRVSIGGNGTFSILAMFDSSFNLYHQTIS